jgi:hypothetical protein
VLFIVLAIPVGALLLSLAVVNRHWVPVSLDPFSPIQQVCQVASGSAAFSLPLFAFVLVALIIGAILGGLATWMSQGQWRREARVRGREAKRWHAEADRLTRERDAAVTDPSRILAPAKR